MTIETRAIKSIDFGVSPRQDHKMKTLGGRCINEYASVTILNLGGFRAGSYGEPETERLLL